MTRLTLLLAVALQACALGTVGSGDAITEQRDISEAVDAFALENFIDTTVTLGQGQATVSITCDDNLMDEIITEVEDGTLRLRTTQGTMITTRLDCHAEVQVPDLLSAAVTGSGRLAIDASLTDIETLTSTGSGAMHVRAVDTCDLKVHHTGSGHVEVDELVACGLVVHQTGSGDLTVGGTADSIELTLTGSGGFDNPSYTVDDADVRMTGSGDAELTVLESVKARLSGSGGLTLHGDPQQRDVEASGSGRVAFE